MRTGYGRFAAAALAATALTALLVAGTLVPARADAITRKQYVKLAASQVGVKERPAGSNKQKYGRAYGWNGVAWCQQFDWWLAKKAGMPHQKTASTVQAVQAARKNGTWHKGTKGIRPGDSIYFHFPRSGRHKSLPDHVGTVERVLSGGRVKTIEGNVSSRVVRKVRPRKHILGYIRHDFDAKPRPKPKPKPAPKPAPEPEALTILVQPSVPGPAVMPWETAMSPTEAVDEWGGKRVALASGDGMSTLAGMGDRLWLGRTLAQ